ncbi:MAG: penicillin acylase family protein [Hymenobacter sp.]
MEGEAALYDDLAAAAVYGSARAVAIYSRSPALDEASLLDAFAAGTNYYLATHPTVQPRLLRRFQPWMPLLFSEGSIGGNVSVVPLERLKAFLQPAEATSWQALTARNADGFENSEREPAGSNGFAIAPGQKRQRARAAAD